MNELRFNRQTVNKNMRRDMIRRADETYPAAKTIGAAYKRTRNFAKLAAETLRQVRPKLQLPVHSLLPAPPVGATLSRHFLQSPTRGDRMATPARACHIHRARLPSARQLDAAVQAEVDSLTIFPPGLQGLEACAVVQQLLEEAMAEQREVRGLLLPLRRVLWLIRLLSSIVPWSSRRRRRRSWVG